MSGLDQGRRIEVATPSGRYDIVVGSDLLLDPALAGELPPGGASVIVTDENVGPLYEPSLRRLLAARGRLLETITLPAGEEHKNAATLSSLLDAMFAAGCDRASTLYALGGGVVGDVAGFAASCFMRGIACVQVPTTLLAQVDSSVGGKTGINHPAGKNLIGAFHQPRLVVIDLSTLASLPERQLIAGLAEVIKYGAACDADFFAWLEAAMPALLGREGPAMARAVRRSCELKAEVVAADELETGRRAILNFGHTFGHAIESALGYGTWLHGEAVGCGMVMAAGLSKDRLGLDDAAASRIAALVAAAGLPVRPPALPRARLAALMRGDKKATDGRMNFVLLEALGRARLMAVEPGAVDEVLARTVPPA